MFAYQLDLLGWGEAPRIDPDVVIERIALDDRSWVDHGPGWLRGADVAFEWAVAEAPWQARQRPMYGNLLDEPRLTAGWVPGGGPPRLGPVVDEIAAFASERYGKRFDSVWCNWYRDGRDSVAWHGDTVRHTLADPIVVIVSLGERRRFLLRPLGGGRSRRFELGRGDLLVMGGACQHEWQHTVPKVARAGPRISVTLRHS